MKQILLVANWKMHFTVAQAIRFVQRFREQCSSASNTTIVLCAPFTALSALRYELQKGSGTFAVQLRYPVFLAAQNIHFEEEGAFTGEIAPSMVKELAQYVLVGHSERRKLFGETDALIHKKLVAAYHAGLIPILCVGAFVREKQGTVSPFVEKDLEQQLKNCLTGLSFINKEKLVIAYEPEEAIGTGAAFDPKRAGHICYFIRRQLEQMFGDALAANIPLLYGGSVASANAKAFLQEKDIDGLLIGGASLDVDEFLRIVKCTQ